MKGNLNAAMCHAMLHDPKHLFRRMWAADAWGKMSEGPPCWSKVRDQSWLRQPSHEYFEQVVTGANCNTNWYEGNNGWLGRSNVLPRFGGKGEGAPAVLGFDESIDRICLRGQHCREHADCCVKHGYNILSLYGDRVPYNICRNLEWQVCAAKGLLPGQPQSAPTIIFARAPNSIAPDGSQGQPLGQCGGWKPERRPQGGAYGYATEDIFYLEVCLFNQICRNGARLFELGEGDAFICDFDRAAFDELEVLLSQTPIEGLDAEDPPACGGMAVPANCADTGCDCNWATQASCGGNDGSVCNLCCCQQFRG